MSSSIQRSWNARLIWHAIVRVSIASAYFTAPATTENEWAKTNFFVNKWWTYALTEMAHNERCVQEKDTSDQATWGGSFLIYYVPTPWRSCCRHVSCVETSHNDLSSVREVHGTHETKRECSSFISPTGCAPKTREVDEWMFFQKEK